MTDKQIQTEVVRLVNDVEYAALGFHATGGAERCIRAKEELHSYIAQLERIAGDLQTLCDKQALMLGERDAQLESVGAGGVGAMIPKQLAVECYECGATHRPGENTLCPTFRPQQIAAPAAATGWKWVPLEPTAEMLQAGQDTPVSESDEDAPEDYKAVYRAMLAAAPRDATTEGCVSREALDAPAEKQSGVLPV